MNMSFRSKGGLESKLSVIQLFNSSWHIYDMIHPVNLLPFHFNLFPSLLSRMKHFATRIRFDSDQVFHSSMSEDKGFFFLLHRNLHQVFHLKELLRWEQFKDLIVSMIIFFSLCSICRASRYSVTRKEFSECPKISDLRLFGYFRDSWS